MHFSDKHNVAVYILVAINIHVVNGMDGGNYVCDVLDYNTVTWWNCDDDNIPK